MQIVTITSQGQVTIPAKVRRKLGITKGSKATVSTDGEEITLKPTKDLLDLSGSLESSKKLDSRKIRKDFGEYLAKHATRNDK